MAASIYSSFISDELTSANIRHLVNRHNDLVSKTKINGLRNILKYKEAVPHLLRLLQAGGIWSLNCETAYAALAKCRVEKVCKLSITTLKFFLILFL